jgi:hypothetical protein
MKATFPVPAMAKRLEEEWADRLAQRFCVSEDEFRTSPTRFMRYSAEGCRIELMDGSVVTFRSAFVIVSPEIHAVAVFSEHCGHHVFPLHDAKVFEDGKLLHPKAL